MRARNRVKQALREGRVALGMELMLGSQRIMEIVGWSGFDYVHLDQEHAPFGFESIEAQIRAADAVGLTTFVRVAENAPKDISRVFEAGAYGVVIPQVRNAEDVRNAISAMYYEPHGTRGMCPVTRAAQYCDDTWDEYLQWVREELMIMPLIENKEALENIDEICALPEVEVIGFGSGDLGQSLGAGALGMGAPIVQEAYDTVLKAAKRHGVVLDGMPFIGDDPLKSVQELLDSGIGMITYDADALMLSREFRRIVATVGGLAAAQGRAAGKSARVA